ncbi:MAG: cysteine--1-D-myo-inosityl 2-amino-2-deoxy-alpha-D-glucopyranoside ligase [Actinomycetota bacterium]
MTRTWECATPAVAGPAAREVHYFDTRSGALSSFGASEHRTKPVRVYVCGITPYDSSHVGHALVAVIFDTLRRVLTYAGYSTQYATNITDVDDPLFEKARLNNEDWKALGAAQVDEYRRSMIALNVIPPDHFVSVSEMVTKIGDDAVQLVADGAGYVLGDTTYFTVSAAEALTAYPDATQDMLVALAGERGGDPERPGKKDPLDAPLWVRSAPDEPEWDVPGLGAGRPGWHLECVTIAGTALGGLPVDIQGGGTDLIFPHHEISRQEAIALSGHPLAEGYMHVGMLRFAGEKMSKSLGNLVLVQNLLDEGWAAAAVRLALMSSHYRRELDWVPSLLDGATARLSRWQQAASLPAAPQFAAAAAQATGHLVNDLDFSGCFSVLDEWCQRAIEAAGAGAGSTDGTGGEAGPAGTTSAGTTSAGPAEFRAYTGAVLGVVL